MKPSTDAACVREREISNNGAVFGCLNVTVTLRIINVNDPPVAISVAESFSPLVSTQVLLDPLKFALDFDDVNAIASSSRPATSRSTSCVRAEISI